MEQGNGGSSASELAAVVDADTDIEWEVAVRIIQCKKIKRTNERIEPTNLCRRIMQFVESYEHLISMISFD